MVTSISLKGLGEKVRTCHAVRSYGPPAHFMQTFSIIKKATGCVQRTTPSLFVREKKDS